MQLVAVIGSSMAFIDGTAVNVALPVLQRQLGLDAAATQWVVEGFSLFLSALILTGGALGDLYGRRRVFVLGIALFALGSLGCALAGNGVVLITSRCVQGIGAALSMPESLALISANFSGEARGRAIGTWSGFSSVTAAFGPVLGGWLTQTLSWRYVFVINLPLAAFVIVAALLRVPESRDDTRSRNVDTSGAVLAALGLGALIYGLIDLDAGRVSLRAAGSVALGIALLIAFVAYERRAPDPMVPLAVFRSRAFSGANVYTFLLYAALGASTYFVPFVLINIHHYTPLAAGGALLPFIAIVFAASRWSGGLVARTGPRLPLVLGAGLAALAFIAYALPGSGGPYWTTFFPAALLLGGGGALFIAPLTTTVMNSVPVEHAGLASGINNAVARTAGLIAIAALGVIVVTAHLYLLGFREAMIACAGLSAAAGAVAYRTLAPAPSASA